MSLTTILLFYLIIGTLCAVCFEGLMKYYNMDKDATIFERITWILLWPIYILLFFLGMRN